MVLPILIFACYYSYKVMFFLHKKAMDWKQTCGMIELDDSWVLKVMERFKPIQRRINVFPNYFLLISYRNLDSYYINGFHGYAAF